MSGTPPRRPGGRTARTEESVRQAVRHILASNESTELTIVAVAEHSGVHRTTIYRRWKTIRALVLDVAVADANLNSPVPASGDLEADLRHYANQLLQDLCEPGGLRLLEAIMAAGNDPDVGVHGTTALMNERLDQFQAMLTADGPTPLGPVDVFDGLVAPLYTRALLSDPASLRTAELDRIVDNLLLVHKHRGAVADPPLTQ